MQRDIEVNNKLKSMGWVVMRFWEKDIIKNSGKVADRIENIIKRRKLDFE